VVMIWQAPYGLHICSAHGRHMTLLCGHDLASTIWVAHMVTICIPYGKHVHMNTIWEAYDIAIGDVTTLQSYESQSCDRTLYNFTLLSAKLHD